MSDQQIYNPYLPNYEYIPDAEPRVFNNRVYIYGSHDRFNGLSFCLNDYVSYSAPVDNLKLWRFEGVIYQIKQDPNPGFGLFKAMFAPDVIQGIDGRYYLYYSISFSGKIAVAVCDEPAGKYEFLGHVKYEDSTLLGDKKEPFQFDPGVFIDDDKRIFLYTGFAPKSFPILSIKGKKTTREGAMVMELLDDMITIKTPFKYIAKTIFNSKGTSFEGHEFFEASSVRKIRGRYYFIYSSIHGHELCYATSQSPDKDFVFEGTLVSIADIGISSKPLNYTGNTHGSILSLKDKHYVFYHRQTNQHSFSRQACAEELVIENGIFKQAEITSQGLNHKPLNGVGKYDAAIACNLYSSKGTYFYSARKKPSKYHAYFTQFGKDRECNPNQHIANFSQYTTAVYKYFNFNNLSRINVYIMGCAQGKILVYIDETKDPIASINIGKTKSFKWFSAPCENVTGIFPLIFKYNGTKSFRFMSFDIQ